MSASLLLNKGCYWPAKEDQRRLSENIARGGLTLLKFETLEDALSCFSHLQERGAKLEGGPAANDLALNDLGDDFECVRVGRLFVPDLADSLAHATHCLDGAGYFVLGLSQLWTMGLQLRKLSRDEAYEEMTFGVPHGVGRAELQTAAEVIGRLVLALWHEISPKLGAELMADPDFAGEIPFATARRLH